MGIKIGHISKKKEEKPKASMENILKKEINIFGNGFSNKKKEQFYSELSVLLKSGVNLNHSLDILVESHSKDKYKTFLEKLNFAILEGSSLAVELQI